MKLAVAILCFLSVLHAQDMEPTVTLLPGQIYTAQDTIVGYSIGQTRTLGAALRVSAERIARLEDVKDADSVYVGYLNSVIEKQRELLATLDEVIDGQDNLLRRKNVERWFNNAYVGYAAGILSVYLAAQVLGSVQ